MKLPFNYSQEEISLSGKILREVFRQNEKQLEWKATGMDIFLSRCMQVRTFQEP